jgi:hypothetical protein
MRFLWVLFDAKYKRDYISVTYLGLCLGLLDSRFLDYNE